ncbi:MAG TPA: HAMP domain-containing sensor histidine kinase, partial [Thermoanaerobaculia bacterium]
MSWSERVREWLGRGSERGGWRRAVPVLFLLVSLGLAGFGGLEAYRAERSQMETTAGVLTDYGEFAVFGYQQRAAELLTQSLQASFQVARSNRAFAMGTATRQCLALLIDTRTSSCGCGRVSGGWSFFMGKGGRNERMWGGVPPAEEVRGRVAAAVGAHARDAYQDGWPFALLSIPGGPTVAYLRITAGGFAEGEDGLRALTDTLIYGFEVDREALAAVYERALDDTSLLPPSLTGGRPGREVVMVEVLEPGGAPIYASRSGTEPSPYVARADIRPFLGGGLLRASVVPEAADQLVIGGLPENRTPILLLIFFLASALAAAAVVQLRRENRLALLRQDFVASVSHELRTPLAQVRLFTETLRLGRTRNEEQREWALESIDRETLRLAHLVENILHFSRAERGVRPAEREPVDLAREARDAAAAFAPLVPAARASFHLDVPEGLVAEIHRDSFRQVLVNFLDNAVRYGPAGQTVRITGERRGERILIAVEDEGPGVPAAERERIFRPFQRGQGAVGTVAAGSGIGLSVVREIARVHGGGCRVEDVPGGGARFVF